MYAVRNGRLRTAEILIKAFADVNHQDQQGRTSLHHAAETGQYKAVDLLLKNKADSTIAAKNGTTALQLAEEDRYGVGEGSTHCAALLKEKISDDKIEGTNSSTARPTSTIPSALDRLGPEGRALYERACKKGEVRITHVLINIMGEEDAGKTCLGDSLMNKPFVEGRASTKGVQFKTMIRKPAGIHSVWEEVTDKERHTVIDKLFAREYVILRQRSASQATSGLATGPEEPDLEELIQEIKRSRTDSSPEKKQGETRMPNVSTIGYKEFKEAQDLDESIALAILLMEENAEEMRKCEEIVIVTIMDRGGQDQFLATHGAIMADNVFNASVCLMVIDGTKRLDETVTESTFRLPDGRVMKQKRDVATKREDIIRHWAAAVDVCGHETPSTFLGMQRYKSLTKSPATFFVATRKDITKGEGELVDEQERILRNIISELKFGDRVVPFQNSDPRRLLFHVDNTRSGTDEQDPVVVMIREIIDEMSHEYWTKQKKIPLPWGMLDKGLSLMAIGGHRVISFQDVCRLANRVCEIVSEDECRMALRYLCSLGTICFYYNVPGLGDKVLPNTQWVADVLSVFVTVLDDAYVDLDLGHYLKTLKEEGLMEWRLAKYLLDKAGVKEGDYGVILRLLQLFNMISPALQTESTNAIVLPEHKFFVPCMVTKEYLTDNEPAYHSAIRDNSFLPPLFFVPKSCGAFLKPLFYRLVSRLVVHYNDTPELSRNQVVLHVSDDLEMELFYTTKAVIATVYLFERDQLPSDTEIEIFRKDCIDARVHLVQELTHTKKRGMDGFEFELCIHEATRSTLPENIYEGLASLNRYPTKPGLFRIEERGKRIKIPTNLGLWYPTTPNVPRVDALTVTSAEEHSESFRNMVDIVVDNGMHEWFSFGYVLGFSMSEIDRLCNDKTTHADKLLAIILRKKEIAGEKGTKTELMEACKRLPFPISGIVEEELGIL